MLNGLDPGSQNFLNEISRISDRVSLAQRRLSSGLRVTVPSDDPDQISNILQTRADLSRVTQIGQNIGLVKNEVDTAESGLQSAVNLLQQARVLGTEGANDTLTPAVRAGLSDQVGSILDQIVGVANTSVGGRFIFSGDSDQQAPYTIDLTQDNPVSNYQGSAATREALPPSGQPFLLGHTADQIFNAADPNSNVFSAVNSLRLALRNNDSAGIRSALANFDGASSNLNQELAFYGNVQNQVSSAADGAATSETALTAQLSRLQDADLAEAATQLSQASIQQQAAFSARAKLPTKSLFDYLA